MNTVCISYCIFSEIDYYFLLLYLIKIFDDNRGSNDQTYKPIVNIFVLHWREIIT